MKKRILTGFVMLNLCAFSNVFGQNNSAKANEYRCNELEDFYQIQVINTRDHLNLPTTICDLIASKQHDTEIKTVQYSEFVRIVIYPRNHLVTKPFNEVVYVQE